MRIITKTLPSNDLNKMAADMFGDIVKAVVDIDREVIAVGANNRSRGVESDATWGKIIQIVGKRIVR